MTINRTHPEILTGFDTTVINRLLLELSISTFRTDKSMVMEDYAQHNHD